MYRYDEKTGFLEDVTGNIICQFWNKQEEDFPAANENGKHIAELLNKELYEGIPSKNEKAL